MSEILAEYVNGAKKHAPPTVKSEVQGRLHQLITLLLLIGGGTLAWHFAQQQKTIGSLQQQINAQANQHQTEHTMQLDLQHKKAQVLDEKLQMTIAQFQQQTHMLELTGQKALAQLQQQIAQQLVLIKQQYSEFNSAANDKIVANLILRIVAGLVQFAATPIYDGAPSIQIRQALLQQAKIVFSALPATDAHNIVSSMLIADITALTQYQNQAHAADIDTTAVILEQLLTVIENLPMLPTNEISSTALTPPQTETDLSIAAADVGWHANFARYWHNFTQRIIKVTPRDTQMILPLLQQNRYYFFQENLRAALLLAMRALRLQQQTQYQQAVATAVTLIQHFDQTQISTKNFLAQLMQLQQRLIIAPPLPTLQSVASVAALLADANSDLNHIR